MKYDSSYILVTEDGNQFEIETLDQVLQARKFRKGSVMTLLISEEISEDLLIEEVKFHNEKGIHVCYQPYVDMDLDPFFPSTVSDYLN